MGIMHGTKSRRKSYGKYEIICFSRFVCVLVRRINSIGLSSLGLVVMSEFTIPYDARETTCVIAGVDMQVTFTYEEPSGEYAIRGFVGIYEIYAVKLGDVDILPVLSADALGGIEEQLEDGRNCAIDY